MADKLIKELLNRTVNPLTVIAVGDGFVSQNCELRKVRREIEEDVDSSTHSDLWPPMLGARRLVKLGLAAPLS